MIPCICIDDSNKPNDIPQRKWVKKGEHYNIIFTTTTIPQKQLGVLLSEIELDNSCYPYEFFLANRFAFTEEDAKKLLEMIKDCNEMHFSIDELMKQTEYERTADTGKKN
jgi:hypothetical protein